MSTSEPTARDAGPSAKPRYEYLTPERIEAGDGVTELGRYVYGSRAFVLLRRDDGTMVGATCALSHGRIARVVALFGFPADGCTTFAGLFLDAAAA